jgi:WD40 repeat protein
MIWQINATSQSLCSEEQSDIKIASTPLGVYSGISDFTLIPITVNNAHEVKQIAQLGNSDVPINIVTFSPDGTLLAANGSNSTVQIWDINTGELTSSLEGQGGTVEDIKFNQDGTLIASISRSGNVILWDTRSGLEKVRFSVSDDINDYRISFSPDNSLLAFTRDEGHIGFWDVPLEQEKGTFFAGEPITDVGFSSNGRCLAYGIGSFVLEGTGSIEVRNVDNGTIARHFTGFTPSHVPTKIAFSLDGESLAAGSTDAIIRVWDLRIGELKTTLAGHHSPINDLAFSPDGSLLASASGIPIVFEPSKDDTTVRLWDLASATQATVLQHSLTIRSIAFSRDGTLLASAGNEGVVTLWGVQSPE